jgi:hypothetical protein
MLRQALPESQVDSNDSAVTCANMFAWHLGKSHVRSEMLHLVRVACAQLRHSCAQRAAVSKEQATCGHICRRTTEASVQPASRLEMNYA